MGIERDAYRVMLGKPDGNGPLGRSRHRLAIILKWILKNCDGRHGLDCCALG
jgi:hypothetical protein